MTPDEAEEITADCIAVLSGLAKDDDSDLTWVHVMTGKRRRPATKRLTFRGPKNDRILIFADAPLPPGERIFLHPETTADAAQLLRDYGFEDQCHRIVEAFLAMMAVVHRRPN